MWPSADWPIVICACAYFFEVIYLTSIHSRKLLLAEFHKLILHPKVWADMKFLSGVNRHFNFVKKKKTFANLNIFVLENFKSETNKHF